MYFFIFVVNLFPYFLVALYFLTKAMPFSGGLLKIINEWEWNIIKAPWVTMTSTIQHLMRKNLQVQDSINHWLHTGFVQRLVGRLRVRYVRWIIFPVENAHSECSDPMEAQGFDNQNSSKSAEWRFHQKPGRRENYVPGKSWLKTLHISSNPTWCHACSYNFYQLPTTRGMVKVVSDFSNQISASSKLQTSPRHVLDIPGEVYLEFWFLHHYCAFPGRVWRDALHGMCGHIDLPTFLFRQMPRPQAFQWTHHMIHLYPIDAEIRYGSRWKMAERSCTTCRIG